MWQLGAFDYFMGFLTNIITFLFVAFFFVLAFCWLDRSEHKPYKRSSRNNNPSLMDSELIAPLK